VLADALSRKAVSMGSLAFIPVDKRLFASDVQTLANQFVSLDISKPSRVLACTVARYSLFECIIVCSMTTVICGSLGTQCGTMVPNRLLLERMDS